MNKFLIPQEEYDKMFKPYYVYHIVDKKIGCTNDLTQRVTKQQGYKEGEYEILEEVDNIYIASFVEMIEQKKMGYHVEATPYYKLFTSVNEKIYRSTDATCGFAARNKNELNRLLTTALKATDGLRIEVKGFGWLQIDSKDKIDWIVSNARISHLDVPAGTYAMPMYVYNKKMWDAFQAVFNITIVDPEVVSDGEYPEQWSFEAIRKWAHDKKLYGHANSSLSGQALKLGEETGETQKAVLKKDTPEILDGIGDVVVVLTSLAELAGESIETCIQLAWEQIRTREGYTNTDGDFIKDLPNIK